MKTKKDKEYSFNHFKERLKERYGFDIERKEYNSLCSHIEYCALISIEKQKDDIQRIHDLGFRGVLVRVVWSEKRQCLTTAIPRGV